MADLVSLEAVRIERALKGLRRAPPGSLPALVYAFLTANNSHLGIGTRRTYRRIALAAVDALPRRPCAVDFAAWLDSMELRGVSEATRNKRLAVIRAVTRRGAALTGEGSAIVAELARVRPRPLPVKRRRCPPDEAIVFLMTKAPQTLADVVALRLAAFGGLRRGELLGLRPDDIVEKGGRVLLHVERTRDRYGVRPRKNARSGRPHVVELDNTTAACVLQLARDPITRVASSNVRGPHTPLGQGWLLPWGKEYPTNWWRQLKARCPQVRQWFPDGDAFHALRHWGATKTAERSGSVFAVQAFLGDSTPDAALVYVAGVRGTTQAAASALSGLIDEADPQTALLLSRQSVEEGEKF